MLATDPDPLWHEGTLFSPVNAATAGGAHIGQGFEAFEAMFAAFPVGSRVSRGLTHLASCPTDNQAEVLVPVGIPLRLVRSIVVRDAAQAERERTRLSMMGLHPRDIGLAVCPAFFDPRTLAGRITSGVETVPDVEPL